MVLGFNSASHRAAGIVLGTGFALGVLAAGAIGSPQYALPEQVLASAVQPPKATPVARERPAIVPTRYPADVVRVLDGDTFEARVRVWPGLEITTKVRMRGIDAPELRAHCAEERVRAEAARTALSELLAQGQVGISRVGLDKYGGRVVADASARDTASVAAALLASGHVRRYGGGHRGSWC